MTVELRQPPVPSPQPPVAALRYPSPRATARRHHGHAIDAAPALRSELRLDGVQRGAVRLHAGVDGGLDQRRAAGPRGAAQPPLAAAHGRALLGAGIAVGGGRAPASEWAGAGGLVAQPRVRCKPSSGEHTSELQSLMRNWYAVL